MFFPIHTFKKEPTFKHGQLPKNGAKVGVLLCNLGTPDAPTPHAVRRFLSEFLSDHRVVELPRPVWWLILHGIILRVRPKKSALKYASIWSKNGSPLRMWTEKQAKLLEGHLGQLGHRVSVKHAMRYAGSNTDSIGKQLDSFKVEGVDKVLIFPAYPQYSATTTASLFDAVYTWGAKIRTLPELRFINRYHDDTGYVAALASSVQAHWQIHGRIQGENEKLLMSFHGLPERNLQLGDAYHCECFKTARLLAEFLQLKPEQYTVAFQSRLGRAKWLQPYTEPTAMAMAKNGVTRLDVICPGFNCDGLETLEEINMEVRHAFVAQQSPNGSLVQFHYIPCLNDNPEWISALCNITQQHLQGWHTQAMDTQEAKKTNQRAKQQGAKNT